MIAVLAAIALPAQTFRFSGGNDAAAGAAIHAALVHDLAIIIDPNRTWSPLSVQYKQTLELENIVQNKLGIHWIRKASGKYETGPVDLGASDGAFPRDFFFKQQLPLYTGAFTGPTMKPATRAWPLNFDSGNLTAVTLDDLSGMFRKKQLRWHWFFNESRLYVGVRQASEDRLASVVASAVGARVVNRGNEIFLDLDVRALRSRALKLLDQAAARTDDERQLADVNYVNVLYQTLSNGQLLDLYKSRSSLLELPINPKTALGNAANRRLQAWLRSGDKDPSARQVRENILARVDLTKPFTAYVRPDGVPSIKLSGRQKGLFVVF